MAARYEGFLEHRDENGKTQEVRILFTNRALAEAEQAMGKGVIGVAQGFSTGSTGLFEVAHLLRAGMEHARREAKQRGRPITLNDAYEILDTFGFSRVAQMVMESVAAVLSYDPDNILPNQPENGADPNG
ncbi:MAG: hypothetical protein H6636_07005 [Anaerolineales bacterium]|nr:hypothetical protein [Anaerolineales bacterium]